MASLNLDFLSATMANFAKSRPVGFFFYDPISVASSKTETLYDSLAKPEISLHLAFFGNLGSTRDNVRAEVMIACTS